MKGMVEYADKAAEPHSRLKYCFNDVVVLCICNGPEVVCVMLIKRLHGAAVTGHFAKRKAVPAPEDGQGLRRPAFFGGEKSGGNATAQKRQPDQIHKKQFLRSLEEFF